MTTKRNSGRLARRLRYSARCLPSYLWQRLIRRNVRGHVHVIVAMADHFEPSSMPGPGAGYAPRGVQQERLDAWCSEYPGNFASFRDSDGRHFTHTYFYPAEQYDRGLVAQLADLCHSGWGEIEIHLHHEAATADGTRDQIVAFRDALALEHGCLAYEEGDSRPKYAFVHGNFALANCAGGFGCGVDNEMQILKETGCYVDLTFPTSAFHPAQIAKINSLYECALPLGERAPQRRGRKLQVGHAVTKLPFILQGPLMLEFDTSSRRWGRIDNGSLTGLRPPSLRRWELWKKAAITVSGRPDWIFIKLHTHGMDPTQTDAVLRAPMQAFLKELIDGAQDRHETLHFVSAREMANIIFAACDGREGNPADYRDYRYRLGHTAPVHSAVGDRQAGVSS